VTNVNDLPAAKGPRAETALYFGVSSTPANSFITDISLWFLHRRNQWLPASAWVSLLGILGVSETAARTALHRMVKASFLQRQAHDSKPGYAMTQAWSDYMRPSEPRVGPDDDVGQWALVTVSVPEKRRTQRHVIRTILGRRGFASVGNGVWIAPRLHIDAVQADLDEAGLAGYVDMFTARYETGGISQFARRYWDVDAIADAYRKFIRDVRRRLRHDPAPGAQVFADVVLTSNAWRRMGFIDPQLPSEALPHDWPRGEAQAMHDSLLERFLEPARTYVDSHRFRT
jgi:phenylacetic acid degradation operon negative regulatory protein